MLECSRCNSSGQIVAVEKEQKYIYCFLCTCEIPTRRKLSKQIPIWSEVYREKFDVEFQAYQPMIVSKKLAIVPKKENDDSIPF